MPMEIVGPMASHISSHAPSGDAAQVVTLSPSRSMVTMNSGAPSDAFVTSLVNSTPESFFHSVLYPSGQMCTSS